MSCLHECLCIACVQCLQGPKDCIGASWIWDWTVGSSYVGFGKQTWILCKSSKQLSHWAISPASCLTFNYESYLFSDLYSFTFFCKCWLNSWGWIFFLQVFWCMMLASSRFSKPTVLKSTSFLITKPDSCSSSLSMYMWACLWPRSHFSCHEPSKYLPHTVCVSCFLHTASVIYEKSFRGFALPLK